MTKNEFLAKIRKKHKASRAKFAKLLEVSPSTIEKTEWALQPVNSESKYVRAICELENIDSKIFDNEEINNEFAIKILQKPVDTKKIEALKNKTKKAKLIKQILDKVNFERLNELDAEIIEKLKYLPDSFKEYVIFIARKNEEFERMIKNDR